MSPRLRRASTQRRLMRSQSSNRPSKGLSRKTRSPALSGVRVTRATKAVFGTRSMVLSWNCCTTRFRIISRAPSMMGLRYAPNETTTAMKPTLRWRFVRKKTVKLTAARLAAMIWALTFVSENNLKDKCSIRGNQGTRSRDQARLCIESPLRECCLWLDPTDCDL